MSATNEFAKLDHRVPIARATTNRIGAGWDAVPVGTTVRNDPASHMPLTMPGGLQPQPLEPPPPPPTETELREVLAQCIASKTFADEGLQRAQASAERGHQYVTRWREKLATFDSLEDEATQHAIEQLRSEAGRLDPDDDVMRHKRMEREAARDALHAAERAASLLDTAALEARVDADHAAKAARAAAVAVMAIEAEQLGKRVIDLEDEVDRMRDALIAFDRVSASTEQPLPLAVFEAIGVNNPKLSKPIDTSAWEAALDQLLGDAQAEVVVTIPERPPPPPVLRYSNEVIHVQPIQRPQAAEQAPEPSVTPILEPTAEG